MDSKIETYINENVSPFFYLEYDETIKNSIIKTACEVLPICFDEFSKVFFTMMKKHISHINSLPLATALEELNIKSGNQYEGFQVKTRNKYFDYDTLDAVYNHFKPKKKKLPKLVLEFPTTIQEDYEHFKINPNVNRDRRQDEDLDFSRYGFERLFKLTYRDNKRLDDNWGDNYYTKQIKWTEDLHEQIIENNTIVDYDKYEYVLFNSIITCEDYREQFTNGDGDEDYEVFEFTILKEFYKTIFRPYFINRYKDKLPINNESQSSMTRDLFMFDTHYKRVFPNKFNRKDNYNEYNAYSKSKSNLKKSYKRYLEGEALDKLPINDKLRLMIYIIEDCSFVKF